MKDRYMLKGYTTDNCIIEVICLLSNIEKVVNYHMTLNTFREWKFFYYETR